MPLGVLSPSISDSSTPSPQIHKRLICSLTSYVTVGLQGNLKVLRGQTNHAHTVVEGRLFFQLKQGNVIAESRIVVAWMRDYLHHFDVLFWSFIDIAVVITQTNEVSAGISVIVEEMEYISETTSDLVSKTENRKIFW